VRAEPQLRASGAEIDHWARHVLVPTLICADTVRMAETEKNGELLGVEKILSPYGRGHAESLTP